MERTGLKRPTLRRFARSLPRLALAIEPVGECWAVLEHWYVCDDEERVRHYGYDPCVVVEASGPEDALRTAGYDELLDEDEWDKDDSAVGWTTFGNEESPSWRDVWEVVALGPFTRRSVALAAMNEWREQHSVTVPFGQ